MNKKILLDVVIVLAAVVLTVAGLSGSHRITMEIDNREDGSIAVMLDKADKGSGGVGYITVADGQKLRVNADLTKKSSVSIKVKPENANTFQSLTSDDEAETIINTFQSVMSDDETVIMEETFTGVDNREFALPAGDYILLITAGKNASGNMEITAG